MVAMLTFGIFVAVVLGMLVGSFLNVCVDRLPAGESIVKPPSHCAACGRRLALLDLIPVFSWLLLRGRCRYCGAKIPLRLMLVEAGTGLAFGYLYWHFGLTLELLLALVYVSVFIVLALIDLDHQLILNVIVYPTALVALGVSFLLGPSRMLAASGDYVFLPSFLPQNGFAQAAIGAGIGLLVFAAIIILSRGGMGWGDAKMAGLIGAIVGYLIPLAIFVAVVVGGLLAVVLLVFKLKKRKEGIPFGPFLAIGAIVTLLWGNTLAGWYLGR